MKLFDYAGMHAAGNGSKLFLYAAGGFNVFAALSLLVLSRLAPGLLGLDPMSLSQFIYVDLFSAAVLAFAVGYALAGCDLPRFWPLVAMGTMIKAMVALIAWTYFVLDATGALPALLASGDALFAVFFYRLLRAHALREISP
jgi:hypothetical protein